MKIGKLQVAILLAASVGIIAGCAAPGPIKYKLDCEANIKYDGCGKVFDDEKSCEAVRSQMIRDLPDYDRGTCLSQS